MDNLTLLGSKNTEYKDDYAPEVLETFDNKHPDNHAVKLPVSRFRQIRLSGISQLSGSVPR